MRTMTRQSNHRNQRFKGSGSKRFFQLFLLIVVCFWLAYQLKHSYNKKVDMEEQNANAAKISEMAKGQTDHSKLGRKDLPRDEKMGVTNVSYRKKHGHEEVDKKETEQETDESTIEEDKDSQVEGAEVLDEEDHDGEHEEESSGEEDILAIEGTEVLDEEEHDGNTQEAREQHYRNDDASSAVHHDTQMTETGDNEKLDGSKIDKDTDTKMDKDTDKSVQATEAVKFNVSTPTLTENGTVPNENLSENMTSLENRDPEAEDDKLGLPSLSNSTSVESGSQTELQANSTESNNETEDAQAQDRNVTGTTGDENSNMAASNIPSQTSENSNADQATSNTPPQTSENDDTAEVASNTPPQTSENDDTAEVASNTPPKMSENGDADQGESKTEKSSASENGNAARAEHEDPAHKTVTAEETEASTDLSNLPIPTIETVTEENEALE